jgi:hypothetical protein
MFQFDTQLFTLQLLPLKTEVHFLTIQQKDILYAKSTPGCKQLNSMSVMVTTEEKLMSYRGLTLKISMYREKMAAILFHFIREIDHVTS